MPAPAPAPAPVLAPTGPAMRVEVGCPSCLSRMTVEARHMGLEAACPACRRVFRITAEPAPEPVPELVRPTLAPPPVPAAAPTPAPAQAARTHVTHVTQVVKVQSSGCTLEGCLAIIGLLFAAWVVLGIAASSRR